MVVSRVGNWLKDGLQAYTGRDVERSPFAIGALSIIAILLALLIAGITLQAYLVFIIVGLVLFLVLYVLYRALRFVIGRLTSG